jgi:hypothetical protein
MKKILCSKRFWGRYNLQIEIMGCESFGARSLACVVNTDERKIVIDPGVALGRLRSGLSPHPVEVAAASSIRKKILIALEGVKFWCKGPEKISSLSARRRKELSDFLCFPLPSSEGKRSGNICDICD